MGQASPNGVIPSQKMKLMVFIKHTRMFTRGLPHELNFLHLLNYLYFTSYWGCPAASAVGAIGEGAGGSLPGGTTFGSIEAGAMSTSDPGSVPSAGWATSSQRMLLAMSSRRTSITHYAETCSAINLACGSKHSLGIWMSSVLKPSAYPLQIVVKSRFGWYVATEVNTPDAP